MRRRTRRQGGRAPTRGFYSFPRSRRLYLTISGILPQRRPLKPQIGEENKLGAARKSKKADDAKTDPSSTAWAELWELLEGNNPESEDSFDERIQMIGDLSDFSNMRDWREPFPGGAPSRGQSCAKFANGGTWR